MVIAQLYHNSSSQSVREILAKEAVAYVSEVTPLLMMVSHHLCSIHDFQDFFTLESIEYTLKNSRVVIEPISNLALEENSNEMLAEMIKYYLNQSHKSVPSNAQCEPLLESKEFLDFCLEHLNIKKLNI